MPRIRADTVLAHRSLVWTQLLDTFETLLETTDYSEITIAQVARHSGVSRNSVYNYAEDKRALLVGAAQRHVQRLLGKISADTVGSEDPEKRLRTALKASTDSFTAGHIHPRVLQELLRYVNDDAFTELVAGSGDVFALIRTILEEGILAGVFRPQPNLDMIQGFITSVLTGALERGQNEPERTEQFILAGIDFVIRGLK